jgi:TM2 domain-containing membrane protein YozV
MDQQQIFTMLPELQPEEFILIQSLTKGMTENQEQQFFLFLRGKRKEKRDIMVLTIIGFFFVAGIQRFVLGETGMGLLYLFTAGLCGIGTIIDLVNLDKMVSEYNQKQATEVAVMVRSAGR